MGGVTGPRDPSPGLMAGLRRVLAGRRAVPTADDVLALLLSPPASVRAACVPPGGGHYVVGEPREVLRRVAATIAAELFPEPRDGSREGA